MNKAFHPLRAVSLDRRGFTLPEVLLATAFAGALALTVGQYSGKMYHALSKRAVRQQADMQARQCMETIERMLSNGKASTLLISTPASTPTIPNSRIQFTGLDNAAYAITWSTSPENSVHLQRSVSSGGTTTDSILATHVNVLFFMMDVDDPSLINVTFQSTTKLDNSGAPGSFYTISLPARTIRAVQV